MSQYRIIEETNHLNQVSYYLEYEYIDGYYLKMPNTLTKHLAEIRETKLYFEKEPPQPKRRVIE